jgi:hypothetical protein
MPRVCGTELMRVGAVANMSMRVVAGTPRNTVAGGAPREKPAGGVAQLGGRAAVVESDGDRAVEVDVQSGRSGHHDAEGHQQRCADRPGGASCAQDTVWAALGW